MYWESLVLGVEGAHLLDLGDLEGHCGEVDPCLINTVLREGLPALPATEKGPLMQRNPPSLDPESIFDEPNRYFLPV